MAANGIGMAVRRKEDKRFLTGHGRYVDDVNRAGQLYAFFVRSPHAHARIKGIDVAEAAAVPGVVAIYTGKDQESDGVGSLPTMLKLDSIDGKPMAAPPRFPLTRDVARHVGDAVAVVIAETRAAARDASELVAVDYEPLDASVVSATTTNPDAPRIWPEHASNNVCYVFQAGDADATDKAFAAADHVTRIELINSRVVSNPMEPRAALAEYDEGDEKLTLYTTSQNPHVVKFMLTRHVLGLNDYNLRVISPDVGGGFGMKAAIFPEETTVAWAARKLKRPVKWTADRSENFVADAHARDHVTVCELALSKDGKFLGQRVRTTANLGAYLSTFAVGVPSMASVPLMAGVYSTPAIHVQVTTVFTNTTPVDAYRGAGRPEAAYVVERLVDNAAHELGLDPAEIRRRNFITPQQMPYKSPVGPVYDSGDFDRNMEDAIRIADYDGFEARRTESAKRGKLRGRGMSTYIEACGLGPSPGALAKAMLPTYEMAEIRFQPSGKVTVFVGTHNHGHGHETTFSQLVADRLGVEWDDVDVVFGDTDRQAFGRGTVGSRSLPVGGSAILKAADKVIEKGRKVAAHILEAAVDDIEFADGSFRVAGTDRSLTMREVVDAAYMPRNFPFEEIDPGLDEGAAYDPKAPTFPNGCHICEVEIDRDTGVVDLLSYVVVDDFGRVINPMIVEGQVQGGIAQGAGQALVEQVVYDDEGQLLSGSFMDYTMPRADNLPDIQFSTNEVLCTTNPLGVKGCGEAGVIGALPAVMNGVVDALRPLGVSHFDMPATPSRLWQVIREAETRAA
ncbi:MAG: carbon monoxide dehydrogenase [Rhodospirillaceae bacterium]|nr:carbon monoxide dehydrogenase [Rhodospirillaceae bacterium]